MNLNYNRTNKFKINANSKLSKLRKKLEEKRYFTGFSTSFQIKNEIIFNLNNNYKNFMDLTYPF